MRRLSSHHIRNMEQGICGCRPESRCDPNNPICIYCIQNKLNGVVPGEGSVAGLERMLKEHKEREAFAQGIRDKTIIPINTVYVSSWKTHTNFGKQTLLL